MAHKNRILPGLVIALGLFLIFPLCALAQDITPGHEQEFTDARNAIDLAKKAGAEKYAPEPFKQAQDLLSAAGEARSHKDAVKFSQASRLARAYAELAKATAELKSEEEKLTAAQEELQKTRVELERLKKSSQ